MQSKNENLQLLTETELTEINGGGKFTENVTEFFAGVGLVGIFAVDSVVEFVTGKSPIKEAIGEIVGAGMTTAMDITKRIVK
ncbi:MAG: hypothetical protein QM671_25685 [Bacillus sp. (in: firmicutes)]|uniref:hypothetical protein n=1 Tax=Bacillus sp. TaxID=1409 RepID=UPI0039E59290